MIAVKVDAKQVLLNLDTFKKDSQAHFENVMGSVMAEGERYAKQNAPWTDRTGNARNSIQGGVNEADENHILGVLSIGMYYGVFLELSNFGKYRIIRPTIERLVPRLLASI